MARDIIWAFVEALEREGVPADLAARVAGRIRAEWGGERTYVPKGIGSEKKTEAIASGFVAGWSTADIAAAYGWPPRTVRWYASRRLRRR